MESIWEEVKSYERQKEALKVPKYGIPGKQEEKHPDILDVELETGFWGAKA